MINDTLVELEATEEKYNPTDTDSQLVDWLTGLTQPWRDYRDSNFKERWEEYYRLWRGIFKENDKTRKSERSKLISPALQQAIEATVAEIEEAVFGAGRWFDISEDVIEAASTEQKVQLEQIRKRLSEDIDRADMKSAASEIFLLGALTGTGIGKLSVDKVVEYVLDDGLQLEAVDRWIVELTPVVPIEFLVDPTAKSIDDSIGCAHETVVPKIDVLRKMDQDIYRTVELGEAEDEQKEDEKSKNQALGKTKIFEYHGLVPESFLDEEGGVKVEEGEEFEDLSGVINEGTVDIVGDTLAEAIVVIANDNKVLKAVRNPLPRADRAFISYQHDTVPNRFWGRGVGEKGYNPQKALDAELRGRIDGMAYAIHPMIAADATKMPRGQRLTVEPGKTILTNGPPAQAFQEFRFGPVNNQTFPQSQDLERMVQMGTGAVDMSQAGSQGMIGSTVGGMGMLTAATIKRTKRTLANIERSFTGPLVRKTAWRYMHFDRKRYPIPDMKFTVHGTLGMMAKEIETQQFANLMKTVPADSPAYWMLLKGVYENSSISNKDVMLPVIDQMMEKALNPPPPPEDPMVEVTKMDIEQRREAASNRVKVELLRVRSEMLRARASVGKADAEEAKLDSETALNLAKADKESLGSEITALLQEVDSLKEKSTKEVINNVGDDE